MFARRPAPEPSHRCSSGFALLRHLPRAARARPCVEFTGLFAGFGTTWAEAFAAVAKAREPRRTQRSAFVRRIGAWRASRKLRLQEASRRSNAARVRVLPRGSRAKTG